jgi:hypothetical protein
MGKVKENYSAIYYPTKEAFLDDVETGNSQPAFVGLLEIVRVLRLINSNKKTKIQKLEEKFDFEQLSFAKQA